jgi:hypothetical protein
LGDGWKRQSPDIESRWENMDADNLQVVVLPPRRLGGGSQLLAINKSVEKYYTKLRARSCEPGRNFRFSQAGNLLSNEKESGPWRQILRSLYEFIRGNT